MQKEGNKGQKEEIKAKRGIQFLAVKYGFSDRYGGCQNVFYSFE
jgi:hypothetical protein